MDIQGRMDAGFLEKVDGCRKIHMEKLTGVLDECITDSFADYKELLMEEIQRHLKALQAEAEQKISEPDTYEEICRQVDSWETAGFVNRKTTEFCQVFSEKKRICAEHVLRLLLGADADGDFAKGSTVQADFSLETLPGPDPSEQEELFGIRENKRQLNKEIEEILKKKEAAETAFRELVRKNAEVRAKMEQEKPEIKYMTRKVPREGFFGFLADLFGKARTETLTDDSELCRWQQHVDEIQREYDANARKENDQIEALKSEWHRKEEEYDQLDAKQKKLEKQFREQMKRAVLEELEDFLYGEEGIFDQSAAETEKDLKQYAEKISTMVWNEYQGR